MNVARASILAIVLASPAPAQTAAALPERQARRDGVIDASRRIRDPGLTDRVAPPCDGRCRLGDGRAFRFGSATLF